MKLFREFCVTCTQVFMKMIVLSLNRKREQAKDTTTTKLMKNKHGKIMVYLG